jgi:hypothetical protein
MFLEVLGFALLLRFRQTDGLQKAKTAKWIRTWTILWISCRLRSNKISLQSYPQETPISS